MKQIFIAVCIVIFTAVQMSGQNENYTWYFGDRAGLDFNTSPPTPLKGSMLAWEGAASISDAAGNLLFYSNGIMVWDRTHHVMPNGSGLMGGQSSSQAALIIPVPNSTTQYYLFATEDQLSDGGLTYSIVDMTLNGGLGDIVFETKNTLVVDKINEQVTAVLHCNEKDKWIVTHLANSNKFLSFLLSDAGLNTIPVESEVGSNFPVINPGQIKASHRGLKIVINASYHDIAEMFDFNAATGVVSNAIDLQHLFTDQAQIYGIEFSPNDSLLYLTAVENENHLYQVELSSLNVTTLSNQVPLFNNGSLQLGPDNKIYMAKAFSPYLDIIHEPDKKGIACLYEVDAIQLQDSTLSRFGLPNILPFAFMLDTLPHFTLGKDSILCQGSFTVLNVSLPAGFESANYFWSDGSTASQLTVDQPGTYWVEVELPCGSISDTIQIDFISCEPMVSYSLEACTAYMSNGTNMDYSEFIPAFPNPIQCATVTASNVFRTPPMENKHSCTPGVGDSIAMCVSSYNSCMYVAGQQASLIMEILVKPNPDTAMRITELEFYEKAPAEYNWIDGGSGPNNFPTKYGLRILKNGMEIYREYLLTKPNWTRDTFDFLEDDDFIIEDSSVIRIELLPYCLVGNGAEVSAWDIDEIKIFGQCVSPQSNPIIMGEVLTKTGKPVAGVEMQLAGNPSFLNNNSETTDESGAYTFNNLERDTAYYLQGFKNNEVRKGVSTLDLITLQRHLLGITPFTDLDQFIAADINRSNSVTAIDLLELRKLLLGHYLSFPNNTSWRFGALPQEMNGNNLTDFWEVYSIENLDKDTLAVDFIGIKIGDINGDIQIQYQSSELESRDDHQLIIWIEDQETRPGIPFSVPIKASQEMDIAGFQMALDLNGMELISISESSIPIKLENYSLIDGVLRFSWNSNGSIHLSENMTLFNLELNSSTAESLSKRIIMAEQILLPEIYLENLDVKKMALHFEKPTSLSDNINFLRIEPNPVTSDATVHFIIEDGGMTQIRIFDISGTILYDLQKNYSAGEHWEDINSNKFLFSKGIIFCQLISNGFTSVEKVVVH